MIGGGLADRFGRKPIFIISLILYTMFSFLNAFAWDIGWLALFRLITGVGLSAMTVVASTYTMNSFPRRSAENPFLYHRVVADRHSSNGLGSTLVGLYRPEWLAVYLRLGLAWHPGRACSHPEDAGVASLAVPDRKYLEGQ